MMLYIIYGIKLLKVSNTKQKQRNDLWQKNFPSRNK